MIAGRRSESSQHRRARFTTARRSAMPSRHYAGTAQAAARPAAFLRIGGGEKRVCSGFFGKPLPKPKPVLTRPAAARFAPEGRRAAHLRVPRSRRGPADRRPAERSAPGPAQKRRFHPRPGGRCAKEKDRSNLPSFFVHILRSAPDFPARPIRSAPETATSGQSGSGRRTRPRGTANRRPSRRKRRPRRSSAAAPAPDSARCGRSASTRPK